MKKTYVHIRLNDDLKKEFEELTKANHTTMTEIVTQCIFKWVKAKRKEQ